MAALAEEDMSMVSQTTVTVEKFSPEGKVIEKKTTTTRSLQIHGPSSQESTVSSALLQAAWRLLGFSTDQDARSSQQ